LNFSAAIQLLHSFYVFLLDLLFKIVQQFLPTPQLSIIAWFLKTNRMSWHIIKSSSFLLEIMADSDGHLLATHGISKYHVCLIFAGERLACLYF